jgi:hypothetical protein
MGSSTNDVTVINFLKLDFENYRGNEMGHFGPKIWAEKDEILSQYLQDVVRRHQSSLLDSRQPDFYKNR